MVITLIEHVKIVEYGLCYVDTVTGQWRFRDRDAVEAALISAERQGRLEMLDLIFSTGLVSKDAYEKLKGA